MHHRGPSVSVLRSRGFIAEDPMGPRRFVGVVRIEEMKPEEEATPGGFCLQPGHRTICHIGSVSRGEPVVIELGPGLQIEVVEAPSVLGPRRAPATDPEVVLADDRSRPIPRK